MANGRRFIGWRKVIVFTEALLAYVLLLIFMELKDAAAILAVSAGITALLASAIYGNVKSKQVENGNNKV